MSAVLYDTLTAFFFLISPGLLLIRFFRPALLA